MQIEINRKGYFESINQFQLIKDIGIGSFGKVKLALHRGTCRNYAIKIIDLTNQLSENELLIIMRQIKYHSTLDHPHIIKLWDTILQHNKIYMIMDYAQNGSLFRYHSQLIQEGRRPSDREVYIFFYQTLQAIKYLHSQDLMHRDIKPENLLLDESFNIKLCDFGWVTNQISNSRSTFCGTYQYMAPEMVLEKSYNFKIDIWALGVLLYELVHGRAPFQAQNLATMKDKIQKGSYQIDGSCSNILKCLIIDILQFSPEKRLNIKQIENHKWVRQKISGERYVSSISNLSKTVDGHVPISLKKHNYQKSLGNFITGIHNEREIQIQEEKKFMYTLMDEDLKGFGKKNLKVEINRKHKRNITQPTNTQNFQIEEESQKSIISKKVQMILGDISNEYKKNLLNINQMKDKLKCKTQAQEEISKSELVSYLRKTGAGNDEKRKQANLTDFVLKNSGQGQRNLNGVKQKQNEWYAVQQASKVKKKMKGTEKEKGLLKIKRIQEKVSSFSNKLSYEREKERKLYY